MNINWISLLTFIPVIANNTASYIASYIPEENDTVSKLAHHFILQINCIFINA